MLLLDERVTLLVTVTKLDNEAVDTEALSTAALEYKAISILETATTLSGFWKLVIVPVIELLDDVCEKVIFAE
jgi:hypothetical protein